MKKENFEIEFYRFVKGAKDTKMLGEMVKALEKRMRTVRDERIDKDNQKHDAGIKKLKRGTKVLVRFGELANQTVEIVRHGQKRTTIKTEKGELWYYSRRSLVYKPNQSDKDTAKLNQQITPVLNKVFRATLGK